MKQMLLRVKMMSLLPIRFINITSKKLSKSLLGEVLFVAAGLFLSIYYGYRFLAPFDVKWKYEVAIIYIVIVVTFEAMFLMTLWKEIQEFMYKITHKGNVLYMKSRMALAKSINKNPNASYSMDMDEGALVTIDYFIKKEKPEKSFRYIHN